MSRNFKADIETTKTAAEMLLKERNRDKYIAIFTGAKSVVSILENKSLFLKAEHAELRAVPHRLYQNSERVVIKIFRLLATYLKNEVADKLAKQDGRLPLPEIDIANNETETFIRINHRNKR